LVRTRSRTTLESSVTLVVPGIARARGALRPGILRLRAPRLRTGQKAGTAPETRARARPPPGPHPRAPALRKRTDADRPIRDRRLRGAGYCRRRHEPKCIVPTASRRRLASADVATLGVIKAPRAKATGPSGWEASKAVCPRACRLLLFRRAFRAAKPCFSSLMGMEAWIFGNPTHRRIQRENRILRIPRSRETGFLQSSVSTQRASQPPPGAPLSGPASHSSTG
jgi:hypothetical protein